MDFDIRPFEPHPLFRNPHAQTLAGAYLPGRKFAGRAVKRPVGLTDGDTVVLHDDRPPSWPHGGRVALLLHGLAGSSESSYMVRIAGKLNEAGVRTFRMDLRGCGAAIGLSSRPYHAGRSEDVRAALQSIEAACPDSRITIIGFSLSGNIVLKLLGEAPEQVPRSVEKAAAVSPPVDLAACVRSLVGPLQRLYDRQFVRLLCRQVEDNRRIRPDVAPMSTSRRARTIFEFDDMYTGPVCGFGSADNYYAASSAQQCLEQIRIPTLILAAEDDPLVPIGCLKGLRSSDRLLLHVTRHGGHLGYIARPGIDRDLRWMEWRIVDWTIADLSFRPQSPDTAIVESPVAPQLAKTLPVQPLD